MTMKTYFVQEAGGLRGMGALPHRLPQKRRGCLAIVWDILGTRTHNPGGVA